MKKPICILLFVFIIFKEEIIYEFHSSLFYFILVSGIISLFIKKETIYHKENYNIINDLHKENKNQEIKDFNEDFFKPISNTRQ